MQTSQKVDAYVQYENKELEKLSVLIENESYGAFFAPNSVGLNKIILKGTDGEILSETIVNVGESSVEDLQTRAQFQVLAKIAKNSGGIFSIIHQNTPSFLKEIESLNLDKAKIIVSEQNLPFERLLLVLLVIALMLGVEWFIRKWMGKI